MSRGNRTTARPREAPRHRRTLGLSDWAKAAAASAAAGLGALVLGGAVVAVARGGAASRPALAALVLLLGALAALLPLRYGIALALVLASFNGFFIDFAGERATYWNELFLLLLVARSVWLKRPSSREAAAVAGVAAVAVTYLLHGSSPREIFWGFKVLLTSVVLGWALVRLGRRAESWPTYAYYALATAAGANVVFAAWQRRRGIAGLRAVGITSADRVREGPGGALRAFGGFTSAAPFSYALAITGLLWLALLSSKGFPRRAAVATAWVPAACLAGIVWSLDRTALVAAAVAIAVVVLREIRRPSQLAVVGVAAAAAIAIALFASTSTRHYLREGFTLDSQQARARIALWRQYLDRASVTGAGPASAGSAYDHVAPPGPRRILVRDWRFQYTRWGTPIFEVGYPATIHIHVRGKALPGVIRFEARSYGRRRSVVLRMHGAIVGRAIVGEAYRPLTFRIPPPRKRDVVVVDAGNDPRPAQPRDYLLALQMKDIRFNGFSSGVTPAERVYERFLSDGVAPGVVDNLYVSWFFQYGVLGIVLSLLWLAVLLWPMLARDGRDWRTAGARAVGVFLVVGAVAVNIWEEAPADLLTAMVFAVFFARASGGLSGRFAPSVRLAAPSVPSDEPRTRTAGSVHRRGN